MSTSVGQKKSSQKDTRETRSRPITEDVTLVQRSENAVTSNVSVGDFVAMKMFGKRKSCSVYLAEITQQDVEEVIVQFLKKAGIDLYMWPAEKHASWELSENIICKVAPPELANTREQFRFSVADILRVREAMKDTLFQFK